MNDITNINVSGNDVFFNEDNYINATEICKNNNTKFYLYFRNKHTQDYLKALSNRLRIPILSRNGVIMDDKVNDIIITFTFNDEKADGTFTIQHFNALICTIRGNFKDKRLQGTWIHPKLSVDFARWLSPKFGVEMDIVMFDVLTGNKVLLQQKSPLQLEYTSPGEKKADENPYCFWTRGHLYD